jgi:hypothetical protein
LNSAKISYEHVLFFGRTLSEYESMFALDILEWKGRRVLDCPSGPSSFVAEARKQGVFAFGCDPIYENSPEHMMAAGNKDIEVFITEQQALPHFFDKNMDKNPQLYCEKRRHALKIFLEDYPDGLANGRYFTASLPTLPHPDKSFDLVLSANLLFFYSDTASGGTSPLSTFNYEFHHKAVLELYRLCSKEVRIYPLKGPNMPEHLYLAPLMQELAAAGIDAQLKPVTYRGVLGAEHALSLSRC